MGIDYSFEVAVGYRLDERSLAPLTKIVPERSHMEERFNEKTGTRAGAVKVVDEQVHAVFLVGGREFEDFDEAVQELAILACAQCRYFPDYDRNGYAVLGPLLKSVKGTEVDDGKICVGPAVKLLSVTRSAGEVGQIGLKLMELGIEPGEPVVMVGMSVT